MARVKLGEVAREYKETADSKEGYPIVGLEHLVPEEVTLTQWDEDTDNTFTKLFRKGQMLFGRRRAYLKKAALAPFDGICSGDITVIEAIEDRLLPDLLPFIIQSNAFFDYAVEKSAGSLSPRVKWEHLSEYEFTLPPVEEQAKLAEQLWAFEDAKKAYKRLLTATDELVKAQFVEMFGDPATNPMGWEVKPLSEIITHANNGMTRRGNDENGKIVLRLVELQEGFIDYGNVNRIILDPPEEKSFLLEDGDFLFARVNGNPNNVGRCAVFHEIGEPVFHNDHIIRVRFDSKAINNVYASKLLNGSYGKSEMKDKVKTSAGQYTINQSGIGAIKIPLPPLQLQDIYSDFILQIDQSKFAVQQTLSRLDQARNALMDKAFS